jgi:hypothetical protein
VNHLTGHNLYLMQGEQERRLSFRNQIKRELAKITVAKSRMSELGAIVARLQADSDAAADAHQRDAVLLQAELKAIDQKHVDAVLAGTELPQKQVERRAEILNEIQTLNRVLDDRCQANRRAIEPLEREIEQLRATITSEQALKNELSKLCSNALRRRRLFIAHQMRFCELMKREADKNVQVLTEHVGTSQRNKDTSGEMIDQLKLDDWRFVAGECHREMARLHEADRQVEAEALSE